MLYEAPRYDSRRVPLPQMFSLMSARIGTRVRSRLFLFVTFPSHVIYIGSGNLDQLRPIFQEGEIYRILEYLDNAGEFQEWDQVWKATNITNFERKELIRTRYML